MTLPEALALPYGRQAYAELHALYLRARLDPLGPYGIRADAVQVRAKWLASLGGEARTSWPAGLLAKEKADAIRAGQSETLPTGRGCEE